MAVVAVLAITLVVVGVVISRGGNVEEQVETPERRQVSQPVNVIPVEQRPYIQIIPKADGRNLTIRVNDLKKEAQSIEYELEYQAGTLLQGAFGSLSVDSFPSETEILLGSCSAGGACTYHEDVRGGKLTTKYQGDDPYALRSDWRYIDNSARETQVSSTDAMFQLESSNLSGLRYIVIFNTAGYPESPDGEIVSELYSLTASSPISGTGQLTIRASEEGDLVIAGWNGTEWVEFDSELDGRMVEAEVDLLELYAAIKK